MFVVVDISSTLGKVTDLIEMSFVFQKTGQCAKNVAMSTEQGSELHSVARIERILPLSHQSLLLNISLAWSFLYNYIQNTIILISSRRLKIRVIGYNSQLRILFSDSHVYSVYWHGCHQISKLASSFLLPK